MRIALVSREFPPTRQAGGIATYTAKTASALALAGHEVHVVSEAHPGAPADQVLEGGVRVHRLPERRARPRELKALVRAWDVDRALRRLGPLDLVQCCEWEGEAAVYALRPSAPLITRLATPRHVVERLNDTPTGERRRSAVTRRLERLQTRRSARVICPSRSLAEVVARDWGLDVDAITIVPTGIRPPRVAPGAALPVEGLEGAPYVLYFGRLEVRKGVQDLLDALPAVLARHRSARVVLAGDDLGVGDGRSFAEYGRALAGADADRLVFLDRLPQAALFPLIAGAAVVTLPSRWESLANACLEAMALGRPVVSTTGSGFAEVIRDGVDGLLVPPRHPAALGAALDRLLADRALAERLGAAALERAREYDLGRMAARLLAVHEEVAGGARRGAAASGRPAR
jgi:glycosyltransferase involved in cell wall biosynthesis